MASEDKNNEQEVQVSTLVSAKLREDFDVAMARRRMKLKLAVAQALELWVDRDAWEWYRNTHGKEAPPRDEKIPPALRRYVDMLVDVLASQETDIIQGVVANLDLFHELLRRRTRKQD